MSKKIGRAEGIDHGTPRGARQHVRRRVLPVCGPCQDAMAAERAATAREATTGAPAFNAGDLAKAKKQAGGPAGGRLVTAVRPLTPLERYRAARLLASRAADEADLRDLLAAAGLTAEDGLITTSSTTPTTGDI